MKKNIKVEPKLLSLQTNMRHFAYSLTLNKDDAEDLMQDTSLRILDNQDKFAEDINFRAWVLTIMKNIFINNYRKLVHSQTIIDKTEDFRLLNHPQNSGLDSPEGAFAIGEISNSIEASPYKYRIPFSMHVQGFKYEEIAQRMNMPVGTVKSRIFQARKLLQEQLKDYRY